MGFSERMNQIGILVIPQSGTIPVQGIVSFLLSLQKWDNYLLKTEHLKSTKNFGT